MAIEQVTAIYTFIVEIVMICNWIKDLYTRNVPELETEPFEMRVVIIVELLTGSLLITGGIGVLAGATWGIVVVYISLGMLTYSIISAMGYFGQKKMWTMFAMTVSLTVLSIIFLLLLLLS